MRDLVTLFVGGVISSCTSAPEPAARDETYQVDCIAILGFPGPMPASQRIPLDAIPFSGAPREKLFGAVSDADLGKLCDFEACLNVNGYRRACYADPNNHSGPFGVFRLETAAILTDRVKTCYATPGGAIDPNPSRESCIYVYRKQFGDCPVDLWEDCDRENASGQFNPPFAPTCDRVNCGPGKIDKPGAP